MAALNIRAGALMANYTMKVEFKGLRVFRMRLWLATQLFRLGAAMVGCGIEFKPNCESLNNN
jgi:hypothetical protein